MAEGKSRQRKRTKKDDRLFTLEACIIGGPMTEAFIRKNRMICRTIQIRGDQTLEDLHHAIFDAFDREEEHMYEFQVGGKGPMDPKARCYVLPGAMDEPFDEKKPAGTVEATIGSLGLKVGEPFGYWFDFGDDWWHQVTVLAIDDHAPAGKYPKVTRRVGESPPQYVDWDKEDDETPQTDDVPGGLLAEVPQAYAGRFADLVRLTDAFCDAHLNREYKDLSREMAACVCQEGSPVRRGKAEGWAAGIVYALGWVNFLTDPTQTPHMTSADIAEGFGISMATMQAKARIIRQGLDLIPLDPDWTLPSRLEDNPLVWMLKVNGVIVDIRMAPREAQVAAYEQGLIPYVPADRPKVVKPDGQ